MSYTWGPSPNITISFSDNVSRDSSSSKAYFGYLTVTLGGCSGKSSFGYYIAVTVDGTRKVLKNSSPSQWSSGKYSASFPISGNTTASSIDVDVTLETDAPRGSETITCTISVGAYSGSSGSGGSGGSTTPTTSASVPTLSKSSAKVGETVTIYTGRKNIRYKHTISYTVGTATGTIAKNVASSVEWEIPTELLDSVKMEGSDCTISVATYYNTTLRGTNMVHLTLYPPDDAMPSVSEGWVSVSRDNSLIPSVNAWVKGYSKAKVTFDSTKAAAKYGASIRGFSITCNGEKTNAVNGAATTGVLASVNAMVLCTVTDSRGYTTTEAVTLQVQDYAPPTINGAAAYRCDSSLLAADDGEHIAARATAGCTALGGANSVTLKAAYKAVGAESYSAEVTLQSGTVKMVTGNAVISTTQSYVVRLTATDKVGNSAVYEKTVSTKAVTFHLKNGGKGAAFGKYAEADDCLECAWDADFKKNVNIIGALKVGGNTLADIVQAAANSLLEKVYPVGSIFTTVNDTDPNGTLPGTWEKIEGKFLLGSSTAHAAGSTGGSEAVTLTVEQMPAHSHTGSAAENGYHYHSFTGNRSGGGSYTTAEGKSGSDAYYTHTTTKDGGHTHDLSINNAGGGQAVDIMPPYLVVYMWKRTA